MDKLTKNNIDQLIDNEEEPCVSIYMSTVKASGNEVRKMRIQFKNQLNEAGKELIEYWGYDSTQVEEFLENAYKLNEDREFWQNQSEGLAVFISQERFKYYRLPINIKDRVFVGEYFNIKKLIPELLNDRKYYVLTLSRNSNRVFECTKDSVLELEIKDMPESLADVLKYDDPEKSIQLHTQRAEGNEAIFHGHGVTDEDNEEDLLRYLRKVNASLYEHLRNEKAPLIVMSVKELFPLYQKINSYGYLLDEFVRGNPDKLTEEEIRRKSLEKVKDYFHNYEERLVSHYNDLKSTGKISDQIEEIVSASYFSKVDYLMIKENTVEWGVFDPDENKLTITEDDMHNDLMNFAARETIKHGGEVYVIKEENMPDDAEIAAVFRY
ncbi:MAG: hypothetical protein ACLFUI_00460 [Halanaerobiales bacterium]